MPFSALWTMVLGDHISMAQRHVQSGELQVALQRGRLARLRARHLPTADALKFLRLLEEIHVLQRQRLSQLLLQSPNSQAAAETQVAQRLNDLILVPDPIFRLALELQEGLDDIERSSNGKRVKPTLH
ncbi:hypothetical protein [Mesorhizobium sp. WSM3224]|uniref:hypothetical protein n=1 Tax=Mesorhizobium sp. WSM3224 TaxID=1040986 RepID=UPI0012EC28E3|nr:hypothetical protein [Mesorhizobium sp. WSM3224]